VAGSTSPSRRSQVAPLAARQIPLRLRLNRGTSCVRPASYRPATRRESWYGKRARLSLSGEEGHDHGKELFGAEAVDPVSRRDGDGAAVRDGPGCFG
jgi:hypothetical protein